MRISILGHASVLIEHGDDRLLVDPVFTDSFASGAIAFHPARTIDRHALGEPTALLVTHAHLDHWHAPTMECFDRDTPVYIPPDPWLRRRLGALGFTHLIDVSPWEQQRIGALDLLPTPSDSDVEEYGFVIRGGNGSYWHMSDCFARVDDAERIRDEWGPVTAVAARYQPGNALVSYQRNLGWAHDEREFAAEWLEAACTAEPRLVFPYFWGVAYQGVHAWANRYAAPYAPTQIARLLRRRLAPSSQVVEVRPGDAIELTSDQRVRHHSAAATFVTERPSEVDAWEPVDTSTLLGVDADERGELRTRLEAWFRAVFGPWLAEHLGTDGDPLQLLLAWNIRWQLVVHLGEGQRLGYHADFSVPEQPMRSGVDTDADLIVHVGGRALLDMLRGEAGSDLFWMAGASRVHERILGLEEGRIAAPPLRGWAFHETLPEPFTWCWRTTG